MFISQGYYTIRTICSDITNKRLCKKNSQNGKKKSKKKSVNERKTKIWNK